MYMNILCTELRLRVNCFIYLCTELRLRVDYLNIYQRRKLPGFVDEGYNAVLNISSDFHII